MNQIDIFFAGINTLQEYLSAHVLTCLIPAFFIAGAIAVFISRQSILKYFGPQTKKYISYSIASISGGVLAVCSCTILPLFTGIYKRGAGIGPATTFLFSGPAVNILAIVLTARILGFDLGLARFIGSVSMSIVIGLFMASIFKDHDQKNKNIGTSRGGEKKRDKRSLNVSLLFFILLVLILVVGAVSSEYLSLFPRVAILSILIFLVVLILVLYYSKNEIKQWGLETWILAKKIIPILLIGVFIVGIIGGTAAYFIPGADPTNAVGLAVAPYIGGNTIFSCFFSSIIGAILYIPTLLEVAIVGNLFGYTSGLMGGGPALSLLLAGPSLSLPNMIVIARVMGAKKTGVYISLVIIVATFIGFVYGIIGG
jgi:hypothetical protein